MIDHEVALLKSLMTWVRADLANAVSQYEDLPEPQATQLEPVQRLLDAWPKLLEITADSLLIHAIESARELGGEERVKELQGHIEAISEQMFETQRSVKLMAATETIVRMSKAG